MIPVSFLYWIHSQLYFSASLAVKWTYVTKFWPADWTRRDTQRFHIDSSSVNHSCVSSHSVMFNSLWPHGLQDIRPPCPLSTPRSLLKLMSIKLVMPSNHLILCCPLLLQPSICASIRVFSSESVLCIRWPKYWSLSSSISLSNEYAGLISFRMDWFHFLAVQGTLRYFTTVLPGSPLEYWTSINMFYRCSIYWCSINISIKNSVFPCDVLSAEYILIKIFTLAIKQPLPGSKMTFTWLNLFYLFSFQSHPIWFLKSNWQVCSVLFWL